MCKYAQNGVSESGHSDACLEPWLINLSSHRALTKKRHIIDSRTVIWCADCSYTLHILKLCLRKQKEQNQNFHIQFSQLWERSTELWGYFKNIIIAKGVATNQKFCITLLSWLWSCSHALCAGHHCERPFFLIQTSEKRVKCICVHACGWNFCVS